MTTPTNTLGQRMQSAMAMTHKLIDDIAPDVMAMNLAATDSRTTVRVLQYAEDPNQVIGVLYAPGGLRDEDWASYIRAANSLWRDAAEAREDGDLGRVNGDVLSAINTGEGLAALVTILAARNGHQMAVVERNAWRAVCVASDEPELPQVAPVVAPTVKAPVQASIAVSLEPSFEEDGTPLPVLMSWILHEPFHGNLDRCTVLLDDWDDPKTAASVRAECEAFIARTQKQAEEEGLPFVGLDLEAALRSWRSEWDDKTEE